MSNIKETFGETSIPSMESCNIDETNGDVDNVE